MRKICMVVLAALLLVLSTSCIIIVPGRSNETNTENSMATADEQESKAAESEDGIGLGNELSAAEDVLDGNGLPVLELDGRTYTYGDRFDLGAMDETYPNAEVHFYKPLYLYDGNVMFIHRGWPLSFDEEGKWIRRSNDVPEPWIACIRIRNDSALALGGIHIGDTFESVLEKYPMALVEERVIFDEELVTATISYLNGKPESPEVCCWGDLKGELALEEEKGKEYMNRVVYFSPILYIYFEEGRVSEIVLGDKNAFLNAS